MSKFKKGDWIIYDENFSKLGLDSAKEFDFKAQSWNENNAKFQDEHVLIGKTGGVLGSLLVPADKVVHATAKDMWKYSEYIEEQKKYFRKRIEDLTLLANEVSIIASEMEQ